ncbi:MAG: cytochrome c3 family protein [Bacteroidota bacterium]|jgi:mono/diheme cytochrome c family protein|nr:c-type cytochrome [Bacteroidota bacterium]MCA6442234.1 c-type cytochrome [Bacteroidota bacterium]
MKKYISRNSVRTLVAAIFTVFAFTNSLNAQDAANGAKIYKQNCAVCHASHTDQKLTGPGLKGVFDRVPKPADAWLTKWIINNEKVIKSGDPYANKIYNDFGKAAMTVFEGQIDEKGVADILAFLKGPDPAASAAKTPVGGGADSTGDNKEKPSSIEPIYLILGVIVILAILIGAFRSVRISLQNTANRAAGEAEQEEVTFGEEARRWASKNSRLVGVIVIILVGAGVKSCWNACYNIGVYYDWKTQKGYKPEQPIKFSHKLHAGENEIACQYCHSSVEKSRHAGIPSVNICMNCHKSIQKGPQYGETEIAKIYAANGFNPKTGVYENKETNPIKWIKVHNLPDHVYFNHSQHVVVGKVECATCHGNLKEMTVAEQKTPLTMKWCIECHRKTEVSMEGNAYYDRLHKALKAKYKGQYDVKFTVDKIGGLECAKCHY